MVNRRALALCAAVSFLAASGSGVPAQTAVDSTSHGSTFPAEPAPVPVPLVPPQGSPNEVNVSVVLSLTGSFALVGQTSAATLTALETLVNAQGGIRGRPLHFVLHDDQTNPAVAVQLVNGLMGQHLNAIVGPNFTAACTAIAPLIASGPVDYCLSSPFLPSTGGFQFGAGVTNPDLTAASIRYLRERQLTRIATLTVADANGQDADANIARAVGAAGNAGLQIVDAEHFGASDVSVAAQIARIKASGAQALVAWVPGTPFGTVVRGISDVALDVPIVTTPANMTYGLMKQFGATLPRELDFPGFAWLTAGATNGLSAPQQQFVTAMKQAGMQPDIVSGLVWDPAQILVTALRKLGPTATADQIRAVISGLRGYTGILGTYDFSRDNHGIDDRSVVMMRWDAGRGTWLAASRPGGAPL
jgi:branched-chain amino acid transport system substrate-binding protein